ncbi:MAG: NIPSNAP family protein [Candidatus Thorarchaeota archaeon]|nr:NIPSNAP family protein [Candidatus Thorarchaeota archaeon]
MTLVILYQTIVKPNEIDTLNELRAEFKTLYEKHNIDVVGHWNSQEEPNKNYYMARYLSDADYQHKTRTLHNDENYLRLTAQLNEIRTDFKLERLTPQ